MRRRAASLTRAIGALTRAAASLVLPAGLIVIGVAACGTSAGTPGPSSVAGSAGPGTAASDVGRYFSIEEVGLGSRGWVTLRNLTDVPASLDTLHLCQPPSCVDLPDIVVRPGAVARIAVGDGSGLEDVAMTAADLDLEPSDGEIALYSTNDVSDSTRLWAYLQWGSTPHAGTAVAIEAGLWREGGYAPSSATAVRLYRTDQGLWVYD